MRKIWTHLLIRWKKPFQSAGKWTLSKNALLQYWGLPFPPVQPLGGVLKECQPLLVLR